MWLIHRPYAFNVQFRHDSLVTYAVMDTGSLSCHRVVICQASWLGYLIGAYDLADIGNEKHFVRIKGNLNF